MDFLQLATERYSVRSFALKPIEDEKLMQILRELGKAPWRLGTTPQKWM